MINADPLEEGCLLVIPVLSPVTLQCRIVQGITRSKIQWQQLPPPRQSLIFLNERVGKAFSFQATTVSVQNDIPPNYVKALTPTCHRIVFKDKR